MRSGDLDDESSTSDAPVGSSSGELYYRGTVIRWSRGLQQGVVRSDATGREIPFELQHTLVLDGKGNVGGVEIREGLAVGYDVGWTSRGLRVTKLFPIPTAEARSER
ncbi:MAG TPA: hypothetical protein VIS07_16870 [Candidatus Binatia bacterium]